MEDWRIKDYLIRCYNLQNKITPLNASLNSIKRQATKIAKTEKCDKLTALKLLKKQLESELAEQNASHC